MDFLRVRHIFITILVVIVTAYSLVVLFSRGNMPRKPYITPSAIAFPFLFTKNATQPQQPPNLPTPKHDAASLAPLSASAYIGIYTAPDGQEHILTEKEASDEHLTASITKLMTGLIASEIFENSQEITIGKEALLQEGSSGKFLGGEKFSVDTLLRMLFIESNNDAAEALALAYGRELFIRRMNEKARALGLEHTWYGNPTGLDPDSETPANHSSARDISRLLAHLYTSQPRLFAILGEKSYSVRDILSGKFYTATTTDQLLDDATLPLHILGGKTGTTTLAKKNLAVITTSPNGKGFLVFVVLYSDDNFTDMKNLIEWASSSFDWH